MGAYGRSHSESRSGQGPGNYGRSCKVLIKQIPLDVVWKDLEKQFDSYGSVQALEKGDAAAKNSHYCLITYSTTEAATKAVAGVNSSLYHGAKLRASWFYDKYSGQQDAMGPGSYHQANNSGPRRGPLRGRDGDLFNTNPGDMPLSKACIFRMAVDARYVGAIIGIGGRNIGAITRACKARCVVDSNRTLKDSAGGLEKVISIYGSPENCSQACLRILDLVLYEVAKEPGSRALVPELRLRVHNNLVGRLIGKGGSTINKIKEDTGCTIFVSNVADGAALSVDRTITIRAKGSLEMISQAEQRVSAKLRQCWEQDMANIPMLFPTVPPGPGGPMYNGFPHLPRHPHDHPFGFHRPPGMPPHGRMMPPPPVVFFPGPRPLAGPAHLQGRTETTALYVPHLMVGSLIGTKGMNIRNAVKITGAQIRIDGTKPDASDGGEGKKDKKTREGSYSPHQDRQVVITGNEVQQNRAQYWVFQRVAEQCYQFFDEVRLSMDVNIPSKLVGRIIGRGGKNVRELQNLTGATVKVPDGASNRSEKTTTVCIIGNFHSLMAVQNRFRQLLSRFEQEEPLKHGKAEE